MAGYIAPRHLQAIRDTGNELVAALDPHDSVGILDRYFPFASFFTEFERFDRHLDLLRRKSESECIQYLSICSPNHLHDAHVRLALRQDADAICEKPLVLNPWNLDALEALEKETGRHIYTVLQLRLHPSLKALHKNLHESRASQKADVILSYVTYRGPWYRYSWKGLDEKSGGLATNIGIHLFDLLLWLFGDVQNVAVHLREAHRVAGFVELEHARVRWLLSISHDDLPSSFVSQGKSTYRSITIDGREIEFSDGFNDLHTKTYEGILEGQGFGTSDARPSIELVHRIRTATPGSSFGDRHPNLST